MIYKNRNSDWVLSKYLLILPLIGLVVMLTGARERLLNAIERKDYKIVAAKNIPVEGTVSDENGKAVKGASVVVKGTTKGTSTDQNGKFKFSDVAIGSTLIVSHINFETFAIEVNGSAALDQIVLRKKDNMLSEVTVQSYVRKKDTPETESQNGKFTVVEQEPQFPGGIEGLGKFLSSTIVYPSEAAKDNVQGKVFVSFTVNESGFVRDPHIIKGIGAGLDEEALRVVLKMPRWEPGKQGGEAVAVQYSLPINFQMTSDTEKTPQSFTIILPLQTIKDLTRHRTLNPVREKLLVWVQKPFPVEDNMRRPTKHLRSVPLKIYSLLPEQRFQSEELKT